MTTLPHAHFARRVRHRHQEHVIRLWMVCAVAACVGAVAAWNWAPAPPRAERLLRRLAASESANERLRRSLDSARAELDMRERKIERWHKLFTFASRYAIPLDLTAAIYDGAVAEGIEPDLGFRLVKVESDFNERAKSRVGALGLTQLMPSTARLFDKNLTNEQILSRERNLRIGFRYLRGLVKEYKNLDAALLVYNRGPQAAVERRARGDDLTSDYARAITEGYKGKGVLDEY